MVGFFAATAVFLVLTCAMDVYDRYANWGEEHLPKFPCICEELVITSYLSVVLCRCNPKPIKLRPVHDRNYLGSEFHGRWMQELYI